MYPDIEIWFTHHPPTGNQPERYQKIREAAKAMAETIVRCCPESADRTAALRQLRECVMTANCSIACNENPVPQEKTQLVR